jgi:hypothetical protein
MGERHVAKLTTAASFISLKRWVCECSNFGAQAGRRLGSQQRDAVPRCFTCSTGREITRQHFVAPTTFFEGSQASPACPSDLVLLRLRWVWSILGMILTGDNRRPWTETCSLAIVYHKSHMAWPYCPHADKLAIDCLSHSMAIWGLDLTEEEGKEKEEE